MVPAGNVPMGNATIPILQTAGLDFFFGIDNTGIDIIGTTSSQDPSFATLCPQKVAIAQTTASTPFPPVHINIGQGTFHPINFFLSPDATQAYIVTTDLGILVYNFNTSSSSRIALINNATPVAAGMTVDGSMIFVAGSDGLLHNVNTSLGIDRFDTSFSPLANSSNSFCYTGTNCALNIVVVRP
jgi:outer membrane protein assembly factor BamB